ncbi:hypothetical protein E2C01_009915 [Portunus trituberculatus]|uniref:Uncharacterized protein n=1 Tax=Portunus trituberculatus TaxID=210409 RepID=A0A5B7D702_PORTR|nr:hypothetical protein [Portunus trituberculatus]
MSARKIYRQPNSDNLRYSTFCAKPEASVLWLVLSTNVWRKGAAWGHPVTAGVRTSTICRVSVPVAAWRREWQPTVLLVSQYRGGQMVRVVVPLTLIAGRGGLQAEIC